MYMRRNQQDSAQRNWTSRLCPECGLCCNGVLFADVRLVQGDDALALEKSGLKLERSRGHIRFQQPCSCFDGRLCTAYEQRPARCRSFDCQTLKQAKNGEIAVAEALSRIRTARREADMVMVLLRAAGQTSEALPLTERYQAVMKQPIDLSAGQEETESRGELMLAMSRLMKRLHQEFLR